MTDERRPVFPPAPRKSTDLARQGTPPRPNEPQPSWMTDGSLDKPRPNPSPWQRLFSALLKPWFG